jgi:hypothetical protein
MSRRQLSAIATAANLGRIRRVYRSRNKFWTETGIKVIAAGAALATIAYFNEYTLLAGIALGLAFAAVGYYAYFVEVSNREGRVWIAVCDDGIIVASQYQTARTMGWLQVRDDRTVLEQSLADHHFGGRAELLRTLRDQKPAPRPYSRYAIVGGAVALVIGLLVWFAVLPRYLTKTVDTLPEAGSELAAACEGPGARFPAAPPYTGEGPHPMYVFGDAVIDERVTALDKELYQPARASVVQLVACVRRSGTGSGFGATCTYSTSNVGIGGEIDVQSMKIGRYTIEVFETRTHKRLGRTEINGSDETCPRTIVRGQDVYTTLNTEQFRQALERYVRN